MIGTPTDHHRYQQFAILLTETIPGLESVSIAALDQKGVLWCIKAKVDQESPDSNFEILESKSPEFTMYSELLSKNAPWEWILPQNLIPNTESKTEAKTSSQTSLYDELNRRILVIRLRPEKSKLNMMVFLTYPMLYSYTIKGGKPEPMSTDQKSLMGFTLFHFLNSLMQNSWTSIFEGFDQSAFISNMGMTIERLHTLIKLKEEEKNDRDIEWLKLSMKEISRQDGITYYIEDSVWTYLIDLKKSPEELFQLLKGAISNAKMMFKSKASYPTPFIISNWHLLNVQLSEDHTLTNATPAPAFIMSRKDRVIAYLDKYELAAIKLIRMLRPVTGANLGEILEPAITASALSEFLKKYADVLYSLFNNNPEKWPTLRDHFKPLQQIISGTSSYLDHNKARTKKL